MTSGEKPQYLHIYNISSLIVLFLPLESNVYFIFFYFTILAGVFELANCQQYCNAVNVLFSHNFIENIVISARNNLKICFNHFRCAVTQKGRTPSESCLKPVTLLSCTLKVSHSRLDCNYYFIFIYFSSFIFCNFT